MADESIGEAAQATAAEGGAVILVPNPEAEAAEHGTPPPDPPWDGRGAFDAHELRLRALEDRTGTLEGMVNTHRIELDGKASNGHEHPVDDDVRILSDELRALRGEEVAPRRGMVQRGWLHRALRGQKNGG